MTNKIVIPNGATINSTTIDIYEEHLTNYIAYQASRYTELGFKIYICANYFRIKYNHSNYYATIIEENNNYYWLLRPYKKSYFTTLAINMNSFDKILFAIQEHNDLHKNKV